MNTATRLTIIGLSLAASQPLKAASVYINSPLATPTGAGTTAAQMKFRAGRNAAWDSAFANGVGFGATDSRQANLATSFAAGQTFQFTLENRPGQGLVYTVKHAGSPDTTVAWGTFTPPVTGTVVTSLGGLSTPTVFNSITFETRATLAGSSAAVSGLVLSSPALSVANGAWQNVTMTPTTAGNGGAGISQQTLFSDINMATVPWTLSGTVTLTRPNTGGSAESVRSLFQLRQTPVSILVAVPEPTSAAAVLAAGLLLNRRRRK